MATNFSNQGQVSAKFTQFNQEKAAALLKEVEAEDRAFEEAEKKRKEKEKKKNQKENDRLQRRNNLLAMGMAEDELEALGLGLHFIDDDPSCATQLYGLWMKSLARKKMIQGWYMLPCNQTASGPDEVTQRRRSGHTMCQPPTQLTFFLSLDVGNSFCRYRTTIVSSKVAPLVKNATTSVCCGKRTNAAGAATNAKLKWESKKEHTRQRKNN